jgi:hypothetical protein
MATDIGYLNYILSNPDLRENAEAAGLTQAEMIVMGKTHWEGGGKNEGRLNSPDAQDFAPGFTQTLGPEHYQGRPVAETLQASVRAGAGSDMWGAREAIDDAWNLGQYTAEGWNVAPDAPYKTGILGDTIDVNAGIGQLVPTTGGNQNFIQDRYLNASLANDFPDEWVTNNAWTGPKNLGGYWDDLTNATRDASGNLVRATPYDASTALRESTNVVNRGLANAGGGLLGNMYEADYTPRGLLDWSDYQTDPDFVLQENNMANYQPWAAGMGALPVYGAGTGTSNYVNNITSGGAYTPVMDTTTTSTNTSNTVKDASGKSWIMTSDGQWIPTDSTYGSILASGDPSKYPAGHYDSNGMWVGAEGFEPIGKTAAMFAGPNKEGKTVYGVNPAMEVGWGPTETYGILGTKTLEEAANALKGN